MRLSRLSLVLPVVLGATALWGGTASASPGDGDVGFGAIIHGTPDDERLVAGEGDDRIFARGGDDRVRALAGDDRVRDGRGSDRVWLGRGNDTAVTLSDAERDVIHCGPGRDTVIIQHRGRGPSLEVADRLIRCEVVIRVLPSRTDG
jgi:Ca2+-binding RTX toxin-like protein